MRMNADRLGPDLQRLNAEILAGASRGVGRTAELVAQYARTTRAFKDGTGHARGSIHHGVRSAFSHFVSAGGRVAPYVKFLEDGTRAHDIRPKRVSIVSSRRSASRSRVPLLRFQINGRWVSARVVRHPGTKPTHFMQDARDRAEAAAERLFEAEMNAVITR